MFLSSWMTYQRRREREKNAAAKIEAKYEVCFKIEIYIFNVLPSVLSSSLSYLRKRGGNLKRSRK